MEECAFALDISACTSETRQKTKSGEKFESTVGSQKIMIYVFASKHSTVVMVF